MSGIYIPRLEELKCDECFWCIGYRIKCPAGNREVLLGIKHPDCPLIPVPDHGRMIDADEADSRYTPDFTELSDFQCGWNAAMKRVCEDAPTIIPADKEEG